MKDRKEQDRLAQERAYQQDLAKRRSQDAKLKAEMEEELAVAQGFRISDLELSDAQKKTDDTAERLKRLRDERAAALNRKKTLDDLREKQLTNEAEIARLEEEISRLKRRNASKINREYGFRPGPREVQSEKRPPKLQPNREFKAGAKAFQLARPKP